MRSKFVYCVCVLVAQLCPTLCNPMDCSLPSSSVHGILQARVLEWVATPFSRKSVYSCSINIHALGGIWQTLESIFFASYWLWKHFPGKNLLRCLRSGSWLVRGQVKIEEETKLHSPVHSTFESLMVQCAVRHCHGEMCQFCWPRLVADTAVFIASLQFYEHTSQI